jgi:hypothetical protein
MEILENALYILAGVIIGYLSSYIKEKGKNKALIEDIKKLTSEKEKIVSKFTLDIEKRKYRYESKREQFLKYYNLIDEFGTHSNNEYPKAFFEIVQEVHEGILNSDDEERTKAINIFAKKSSDLFNQLNEKIRQLRAETNSVKVIASDRILEMLNELDELYDISTDTASNMFKDMTSNIIENNQDKMISQQEELFQFGEKIKNIHDRLMIEIRNELNEI